MPFTASAVEKIRAPAGHVYDVEMPYRRVGRCRMSDTVAAVIGTEAADVALALSAYEARSGKYRTAAELLGSGVDLGAQDAPMAGA